MKKTILLPTVLILSACADSGNDNKKSNSVTPTGQCTSAFTRDYNAVIGELELLKIYLDSSNRDPKKIKAQATSTVNACSKFFASHPNITCQGEKNYEVKTVKSEDLKNNCDLAQQTLDITKNY